MGHDFTGSDPNNKRYSSTGALCTGIDGYMDYYNNPNRWSPCSVEDITKYYNFIGPSSYESSCMKLLENDSGE